MSLTVLAGVALVALAAKGNGTGGASSSSSDPFTRFDALFQKHGAAQGVAWQWLKAIAMNESSLGMHPAVARGIANPRDPASVSDDGKSYGLMQVLVSTARDYEPDLEWWDLNDPETSVRVAAKHVAWLKRRFSIVDTRYLEWVIKSYNQGHGATLEERAGKRKGAAHEYWARFQRNLAQVESKQGRV